MDIKEILSSFNDLSLEQQELFRALLKQQGIDIDEYLKDQDKYESIQPIDKKEYYAVSSAQKRLYALSQMEGGHISYNMPSYVKIEGSINKEKFQEVFNRLLERHEALRTYFVMEKGEPVQKIHDELELKLEYVDSTEEELEDLLEKFIQPFELDKAPLLRVKIISLNEENHVLAFDMHHTISDGITMSIIIDELSKLYSGEELEPLKLQYKDFAEWQNKQIETGKIKDQEEYWLDVFKDDIPVLDMATDYPRPTIQSFQGKSIVLEIDEELTKKLYTFAKATGSTLYIVLLAAYNVLLSKYSNQEDIVVGSPVAGRSHSDLENIVGMFINTIAMRNYPTGNKMFVDFIKEVKESSLKAFENQDYQFEMLVEKLNIKRDLSRNPLFDTVFVMQNTGNRELKMQGLKFTPFDAETNVSKFDITLNVEELKDNISFDVEYSTKLFNQETMERFISHYINVLNEIIENPSIEIADINILNESEEYQLLNELNATKASYPQNKTIKDLFEEQAERTPDNVALTFGDEQLTYKELNEKANRLANTLRDKGVQPETIVSIMVERSMEMIIGILGIVKAGGGYLPIDPNYPEDRINYMLEDSGAKLLLTKDLDSELEATLRDKEDLMIIDIDDEGTYSEDNTNPEISNSPNDLAYIIYTSGTTGRPKGVMIENRNVVRLLFNDKMQFDFNSNDAWTIFHSITFDFSVWEMYGALLYGGKLVIVPRLIAQEPNEFLKLLKEEKVTVLNQTPTAFYNLINEEMKCDEKELSIRYVVFGGEALKPSMLKDWRTKYPETKLINMYGITETTVHVTYKEITEQEIESNISNIGKPIPTLTTYVMDRNMMLLPIGVAGELCVGGAGVCRGYLGRPELTKEKFVTNPYKLEEKIYKSGDLVKMLPNGEMEYLGRIDHQVKIRGHRIELGEIENQLLKHELVKEAVVIAKEDTKGDKSLCAYMVSEEELDVQSVRSHLLKELPNYMIPSYFVEIESMPLTSNGKVNKKALPDPYDKIDSGVEYVAPENKIEEKLQQIWQEALMIDKIGVKDSFFSIGGDSIKAITLISNINTAFETNLHMKDIYMNQTIRELASNIDSREGSYAEDERKKGLELIGSIKEEILEDEKQVSMLPKDWEDFYPLSQIQNGMVFYSKLRPDEPIYHDQFIFPVKFTKFNMELFTKALKVVMSRHQILRTVFDAERFTTPIQVVIKDIDPELSMEDISDLAKEEQEEKIREYLKEDVENKFKFDNQLLWRMGLFKVDKDNFYIILSFQHAILDGWSVSAFNKEFIEVFSKLLADEEHKLQELKSSYKDYVAISMTRQTSEKTKDFWGSLLDGYSRNKLPFNIFGKRINGINGSKIYRRNIDNDLLTKLDEQAKKYECSIRDICLTAHVYLLGILSTETDVVTGVVTHDRPVIEDAEKILGCFLNTVPIRMKTDNEISKLELLEGVKNYLRNVKEHELFLSDIAAICGSTGRTENPIFDTLFNFTDFHVIKGMQEGGVLEDSDYDLHIESSEMTNTLFDLEVSKTLDTFSMQIKYAPGYFYERDIETAMNLYIRILEKFIDENVDVLNVEELINEQEKNEIVYEFNDTVVEYPRKKTMHQLFEEQVERTPENIAIKFEDETITYIGLNEKANQLARILIEKGVKSGDNVGLIMERNFDMMIGMLGILKAGGAYVPIDPDYPQDRNEYILESAEVSTVVVCEGFELRKEKEETLNVVRVNNKDLDNYPTDNLNIYKDSKDLAYIIYTSGSTGVPKGVRIEHHSAVNLINWVNKEFEVGEKDTLLFITSMCFDLSVYDIFGTLAAGGKIVIGKKEQVQNPEELCELLKKEKITFWDSVPSTLNYVVNSLDDIDKNYIQENLKVVFMSGDWIPVKLPEKIKDYFPNTKVISLGGATEGTIWSIYYPIEKKVTEHQTSIPYGRPLDNNYFYILDDHKNLLPKGVAGELYIGGVGVARGYMNNEEKTTAAFMKDKFQESNESMMYKTGDLGRMLPTGNIEFLGRKDHQVKIRGYRVELGEIESNLQKHEMIKEAVVKDRTDTSGNKYLCAYIVSEEGITVQELREYLATKLPEYMIPSHFMNLEKLPLTSNGKIDRKALPEPDGNVETGTTYEEPKNETEEKLVSIWREILGIEKIGVQDNFFELGGHSLKATTLASKIHKELDFEIPLREIFATPTIREISNYIAKGEKAGYSSIKPAKKKKYYPLSPAQKRLYLLSIREDASIGYNTPDAVEIKGKLNKEKLENIFDRLIQRHEALRTSFDIIDGEPVQIIHEKVEFSAEYTETENDKVPEVLKNFIQPFDLKQAPLLRIKLISVSDEKHILAYDMHHIISDGVSMKILIEEFGRMYNGEELKPLRIQYKDFSEWQNERIENGEYNKQEEYWLDMFKGEIPQLDLPTDYSRPEEQSFDGDSITVETDKETKEKLESIAKEGNVTMYMLLLSAYNVLLSKYAVQEDIIIGSPTSGRLHADLENVMGMFVNTLAMRNQPKGEKIFNEFLKEVKDKSLKAFENQDYQFDEMVEKLNIKKEINRNPLFDVMFVMQNVADGNELDISGLKISPYEMDKSVSKFDLTLEVNQIDEDMVFRFEYSTKLFKPETIERMANDYLKLINYIIENTNIKISDMVLEGKYKEKESVISEEISFNF